MRYLISYDLDKPGQNYDAITNALQSVGAKRVLFSQWVVNWSQPTTAVNLREWLKTMVDVIDRLLVVALDPVDWAGYNLMVDPNTIP